MPNSYFSFKKFSVYHDKSTMKVGTDGVLIGAWSRILSATNILDVGTGSGLIALMIAQRASEQAHIDAIDIDSNSIIQAQENANRSIFKNIKCEKISLQHLALKAERTYDLIVSNPPYFESSLVSTDCKRTLARHTKKLNLNDLLVNSSKLLTLEGRVSFILPYDQKQNVVSLSAQCNFNISRITNVYPNPSSNPKRVLFELTKLYQDTTETDLIIEIARHQYSDQFIELVKDYYLDL